MHLTGIISLLCLVFLVLYSVCMIISCLQVTLMGCLVWHWSWTCFAAILQATFAPIKSPFSFSNYKKQRNSLKLQQLSFIITSNLFCYFLIIIKFEGGYGMTLIISSQPNLYYFHPNLVPLKANQNSLSTRL